ncbi:hypothetical protein HFD88_003675 [Aspergillus terreus]|nr:hypothetical protein HFD88_003675 [Aspergillus terreus]
MADTVEKAPETDTGNNDAERTKRRPPKLRRRADPAIEPTAESNETNKEPSYPEESRAPDGDISPTGSESGEAESYHSQPEPPASEAEEEVGPPRAEQPAARPTSVMDRPKTAPVGNWQRRTRGGVGEVGKTVNGAVDAAQDVGSKAVRSVGSTLGKVTSDAVASQGGEEKGKEEQLRLRLDLNLDIEVQLKAKIHGDLTLQLLN